MKLSIYIQSNGILKRNSNTIQFVNEDIKKTIPIAQIRDIHCFGKVTISSGVIGLLSERNIPVHFYNMFGTHVSSLYPKRALLSGKVLIAQAKAHLSSQKRNEIARIFVESTRRNMRSVLQTYKQRGKDTGSIEKAISQIPIPEGDLPHIMAAEAQIWKKYYQAFDIIAPALPFVKRTFHPPENEMNSLISLANTMIYNSVLSMISQTYLDPTISFLHEPAERRYSLSLDIAEAYKPILGHRVIFNLVNTKQININSFSHKGGIRLKENKFQVFLKAFQDSMNSLVKGKKKVRYHTQIKYDCHRLVKHILGGRVFSPYTE